MKPLTIGITVLAVAVGGFAVYKLASRGVAANGGIPVTPAGYVPTAGQPVQTDNTAADINATVGAIGALSQIGLQWGNALGAFSGSGGSGGSDIDFGP